MAEGIVRMKSGRYRTHNRKDKGSAYRPEFCEQLKQLVIERGMVNSRGQIAVGDFARLWKVSSKSILNWKNPKSKYYQEDFAKAWAKCQKAVDANEIKRGLIECAKWHKEKTTVTTKKDRVVKGKVLTLKDSVTTTIVMPPSVNAAKICLHNLGKAEQPEERWNIKEQFESTQKNIDITSKLSPAAKKKLADEYAKEVLSAG